MAISTHLRHPHSERNKFKQLVSENICLKKNNIKKVDSFVWFIYIKNVLFFSTIQEELQSPPTYDILILSARSSDNWQSESDRKKSNWWSSIQSNCTMGRLRDSKLLPHCSQNTQVQLLLPQSSILKLLGAPVFREDTQVNLELHAGFLGVPRVQQRGPSRRHGRLSPAALLWCPDVPRLLTPLDDKAFEIYNGRKAPQEGRHHWQQ